MTLISHGAALGFFQATPMLSTWMDLFWLPDDDPRVFAQGYGADMYSWNVPVLKYAASEDEFKYIHTVDPEMAGVMKKGGKFTEEQLLGILREFEDAGMYDWWSVIDKYGFPEGAFFKM